ncbi:MAG: signal peptidase II [Candidatus Poribacteria bacterium]|nr:signal peptidase II [Candidatus Poribacteria bacterium]
MLKDRIKLFLPLLGITSLVLAADQLTKWLVQEIIVPRNPQVIVVIEGIFELSYTTNTGAAFGLMRGQNLILTIITIVAIGFIFVYYKQYLHSLWMRIALSVLLGGALGNFLDRIRHGEVTDFLRFRLLPNFWWPTFNLADVAVCVGAGMLIIHLLRHRGDYDDRKQNES